MDICVTKTNEIYLNIECESGIAQELTDFFTFDVPGAKYMPAFRARRWDGKARLFNAWTKEIYVGLLPYVREFAKNHNYTIHVDIASIGYDINLEKIQEFTTLLQPHVNNTPIAFKDYQIHAIHQTLRRGRTLLLSPTASGKSLIMYGLVRFHERKQRKQLIIVPTTSLVEQLYTDFADYSSKNNWNVADHCTRIYAGHDKTTLQPVVISTWQSIYKMPKSFFEQFDVIYGDEAHLFKSRSLITILNKCPHIQYRIGMTGTLDGTKTHKLVLEGLFGTVQQVTTTRQLMDSDDLAKLKITCIVLQYPPQICESMVENTYQEEIDFLVRHEGRNKLITQLALRQTGNTLILFQFVEKHGHILHEMIRAEASSTRHVFYVFGGTDTDQRERVRELTEQEHDAIIVASYGTFSTGINIRNLHNIIFASPSKSRIRNLQSIGRGLRKGNAKLECRLFDIGDNLSWKRHKNYTLRHLYERIKIYQDEGFEFNTVTTLITR